MVKVKSSSGGFVNVKVKGIALFINFFSPDLKDLSSSKIKVIECLTE